ncbi:signal peptidase II [Yoonia litorea]|uniref:Lipoprotein signal peptidase n=1 Tax=Yoonia litorea TaxID=1123755 RepID=A0A1I6MX54_9RHOB|nr:signal peptidase II [Yoonia litorea]SFS20249.1 signal peptidase II [Yoonia litorea]
MRLMTWTAIWIFFLDQVIKFHVLFNVFGLQWQDVRVPTGQLPYPPPVEVFPPFLVLTMAWNRGVNFGLFAEFDMRWVLIGVAFAISIAVVWWLRRSGGSKWVYLSGGLLIGGAMGNVIDRIFYGAVADFLNMSCCGISNPYAFNVADISIFLGAIGLAFLSDDKKKAA